MKTLYETDNLIVQSDLETAYLINKQTNTIIFTDTFYGNPTCALISNNNDWCIIAGEHITIWKFNDIFQIEDINLKWIHDIRLKTDSILNILTDPWHNNAAIWELDINTLEFKKIKDFKNYLSTEYTENVIW